MKGVYFAGNFHKTEKSIKTVSPSTGEIIDEVSLAGEGEIEKALQAAWEGVGKEVPRKLFSRLREVLSRRAEEVAELIAREQGKPVTEALAAEIYPSLSYIAFLEEKGEEFIRDKEMPPEEPMFSDRRGRLIVKPTGITLAISPWNYPFAIPFLDIVASIFASSPVLFRPSSLTPLVGLKIAELFQEAGFPPFSLQVLITTHGDAERIIRDPRVSTVMFTGSLEVGKKIGTIAGEELKRAVLELGGKDAMVVFEDANLERAVNGALWAGFMNAGQTCASVERLIIHHEIAPSFLKALRNKVKKLRVGDPLNDGVDMGPMVSENQREKVLSMLSSGEILAGGNPIEGKGFFMEPTLVYEPPEDSPLWQEEVFGPVISIKTFKTEEEALRLANNSKYGLTASVWTKDRERARRVSEKLEAGVVTVNDHLSSYAEPSAPWGGVKGSGLGRTHGSFALREVLQPKYIMEDFSRRKKLLWWFPYGKRSRKIMLLASRMLYGKSKLKALLELLPYLGRLLKEVGLSSLVSSLGRLAGF